MGKNTNGKSYDVFITHHNSDLGWVKLALLPKLEEAGIKAAVADERLVRNGTGHLALKEGVEGAHSVLAIITPTYCKNMLNQVTEMFSRGGSKSGKPIKLIPLVIQKSKLPLKMRLQRPIDLTDPTKEAQNWGKLLARLR